MAAEEQQALGQGQAEPANGCRCSMLSTITLLVWDTHVTQ